MSLNPKDPKFANLVTQVLDQFERNNGVDESHSRVVYAILLAEVFKRYMDRFGLKSARIVMRNLFNLFYRRELVEGQRTTDQIKKNINPPKPT